jgi:hypothetical protein
MLASFSATTTIMILNTHHLIMHIIGGTKQEELKMILSLVSRE